MKKISTLFLLAFAALCGITSCKDDPEAINNAPEVFVDEATNLMRTSAVLTGRIMAPANAKITEYGFKISSTSDFTSADTDVYRFYSEEGLGEFSKQITDLEINGTYFYVAYATNGLDEMTSTLKTFTTPTRSGVLLGLLEMVDKETLTFRATLGDTGGGEINAVGFCWATDDTPTTYDETVLTTLDGDNTFTASLTGLEAGVTYYVRAFADSDILGDGTTQTISYSRDALEIRLEEDPEPEPEPDPQPAPNEIWYTSTDGNIVEPYAINVFGANIVSNTYENGQGVITFDGSVTKIGDYAFYNCTNLTNIVIPNSITSIGLKAFSGCTGLISVTIGNGVTSIGQSAFSSCCKLTKVEISDLAAWCGIEFSNYSANPLYYATNLYLNGSLVTDLIIPDGFTSIGRFAFYNCSGLTSVTIPDSVTSIGESAFYDCSSLTSVTIPDSVTSIGYYAFGYCNSLTSVTIGSGVTSIGNGAFDNCTNLTNIVIPDSVTEIGGGAFCGCAGLTSVYCKPTTPPMGGKNMFDQNASDRKIYVPNASVEAYKAAQRWIGYASSIVGYDFSE